MERELSRGPSFRGSGGGPPVPNSYIKCANAFQDLDLRDITSIDPSQNDNGKKDEEHSEENSRGNSGGEANCTRSIDDKSSSSEIMNNTKEGEGIKNPGSTTDSSRSSENHNNSKNLNAMNDETNQLYSSVSNLGMPQFPITPKVRVKEVVNDKMNDNNSNDYKNVKQRTMPLPPLKKNNDNNSRDFRGEPSNEPTRAVPEDGNWPSHDYLSFTRSLIFYGTGSTNEEHKRACQYIQSCRQLRQKYYGGLGVNFSITEQQQNSDLVFQFGSKTGTVEIYDCNDKNREHNLCTVPDINEFYKDYSNLERMVSEGFMRSFCFQRLQLLSTAFKMHITMNANVEMEAQSNLLGTDYYRTMKIDNHIHAAAAPSAKLFVDFVRSKLQEEGNTIVLKKHQPPKNDGEKRKIKEQTLNQVYKNAGLDIDHLTIDAFNVLADYSVYQRFDNFNSKYSPFRLADFRRIFLKTNNDIGGRYFAEMLKIVLNRLEASRVHMAAAEMRLSIYGMEKNEWYDLSKWLIKDWEGGSFPGPVISTHNRWIIQIPRLWRVYSGKPLKEGEPKRSFLDMLKNIFTPIFEATLHPDKHPEIAKALTYIVAIDSVDDEDSPEDRNECELPSEWTSNNNPSYWWQLYYLWSNLEVLNQIRKSKGLNTLAFRPHSGETGNPMHLAATYMLCKGINHGINLEHQVSLQYLYYLDQIGCSISPLSNNFLFRKIRDNPFPKFFRRGLNVTLSTDDPLLFHLSDEALLEEYSVARASFDLSMTDLLEIARNSILQSGFEDNFKKKWLGPDYAKGVTFCDERITHVPLIRAKFRAEHLAVEHMFCHLVAAGKGTTVLNEMKTQFGLARDAHRNVFYDNVETVPTFPERGSL